MGSNTQIYFLFSNDFFDVIVRTINETERLELNKIPNMLIVKEMFNSPCSALMEYFRQMEIDLNRARKEIDISLEKCIEREAKMKRNQKNTNIATIVQTDEELTKFLSLCDYKTMLFARNCVLEDNDPISESTFILGLLRNRDEDFLKLLEKLDKVHLKPWLLQMHFNGVLTEISRIQTFKKHFYS